MNKKILALWFFASINMFAQNNEVLSEAYLLKAKTLLQDSKLELAEKYLKKVAGITKENSTVDFLEVATSVYFMKKDYKQAKKYADAYFMKEKNKSLNSYKKMLLLYADINDSLPKGDTVNGADFLSNVNKDYYKIAKQLFDTKKYSLADKVIKKYFKQNPSKSSIEYQNMLLLKVDIIEAYEKSVKRIDVTKEASQDVPFTIIEEVPVFPGCKGDRYEKKNCLNRGMRSIIVKNFNADLANNIGLPGGKCIRYAKDKSGKEYCVESEPRKYRILIQFKIDIDGSIQDIYVRAPHPKLKREGERIANLVPKMKPGMQRGKPVRVGYTLPITFNVE